MQPAATRPSYPSAPTWKARDFVLTIVGGFAGAFFGAALAIEMEPTAQLLIGLLFQSMGYLVAIWYVARRRSATLADMGLVVEPSDGLFLFVGAGLQILLSVLIFPIAQRLELDGAAQEITNMIDPASSTALRIALVLTFTLLGPVTEELMFRGMLYQLLEQRRGFRLAVFGSALVFASFHLIGQLNPDNFAVAALLTFPQLVIVGVVLANTARRRARLGVSIFIHAGFNLVAILAVLYAPELA